MRRVDIPLRLPLYTQEIFSRLRIQDPVEVENKICFLSVENAYAGAQGGIFDCHHQYPLMLHRKGLFRPILREPMQNAIVSVHKEIIPLSFRANDFFSHAIAVV